MSTDEKFKDALVLPQKVISISSKNQITIPQLFFNKLNFGEKAICSIEKDGILIKPMPEKSGGEFAEFILAELIEVGLSGKKLLSEFKKKQSQIRPAVEKLLQEADKAAKGSSEYYTIDEIFDAEDTK